MKKALVLFRIHQWDANFEDSFTRKRKNLSKVHVPNGAGKQSFVTLMKDRKGMPAFGLFVALCQFVSRLKPPREGWITWNGRRDGVPLSVADIAHTVYRRPKEVGEWLGILAGPAVGWIEKYLPEDCQESAGGVADGWQINGVSSATDLPGNKREREKERKGNREITVQPRGAGVADFPPPAVQIYQRITAREFPENLVAVVCSRVGEDLGPLQKWADVVAAWSHLHNPNDVAGMLDWLGSKGIPEKKQLPVEKRSVVRWAGKGPAGGGGDNPYETEEAALERRRREFGEFDEDTRKGWARALEALRLDVGDEDFGRWIVPLNALGWDGCERDGWALVLEASSIEARHEVVERFQAMLHSAFSAEFPKRTFRINVRRKEIRKGTI